MSERVFSKGGNIVTVKRTRLNPKKVEKIVIIQENKKRVKEFMKKTTYEVKPNEGKCFLYLYFEVDNTNEVSKKLWVFQHLA